MIIIIAEQNTQRGTDAITFTSGEISAHRGRPLAASAWLAGWLAAPLNALKVLSILSPLLCRLLRIATIIIITAAAMITDGGGGFA